MELKNPPGDREGLNLFQYSFFSRYVASCYCGITRDQHTQDRFGKAPEVEGRLIIILVNFNLLVGMDNVSVFHTGWFLWKSCEES